MKKTMLVIALAILSFVQINAQVVTIGTGTENDDGLPIDPYYKYSYSQCLYLASEINQTGNIYRIKYKGKTGISISNSNDWTIYMGHTSNTTLVSNSWIPTSAMTQVFTGTITVVNDNVEITLTTPFNYNGTDNLIIAVDENQNNYDGSTDDFLSTNVTGQRSLLYRNDNTNPDPTDMSSLNSIGQSAIANIDLDFNATACNAPTALSATNITTNSADISWTAGGTETSWNLEYGVTGFVQGTGTTVTTSSNFQNLSSLTPGTTYDVYLQANCGSGSTSAWTIPFSFSSACVPITNFNEGFEGLATYALPNCWSGILDNGTGSTASIGAFSTGSPNSGTSHIRMFNGNSPNTSNIILVSPQVSNLSAGTHQLRFYAKNSGSTTQDLEVGTLTNPTDGSTFTSLQSVDIDGTYNEYTVNFNSYSGTNQYIAIRRISTVNYTTVYLDDIIWEAIPSCISPTSLTVSNITATSADLGWTESGTATTWNIEWGATGFTQGNGTTVTSTTVNPYNLSGLTANTSYDFYIQADCGGGDTSTWSGPFTFTTACSAITSFNENFDGISTYTLPNCWNKVIGNGASNTAKVESYAYNTPHSGSNHIRMYNDVSPATANIVLVSPLLSNLNAGTHWLRFYAKNSYATEDIQVGTMSNPADGSTFTSLQTIDINETYTEYTVNFNTYSGTDQYIAIRRISTVNYTTVYLDDIIWETAPSCLAPTSLTASNTTVASADLSWTESGSATTWNIEYGATGFTQGNGTTITGATTNPYSLNGLAANTSYDFYVQADCGGGDTSTWAGPFTFTTLCGVITNFNENFESVTTPNLPNCWGAILDNGVTSYAHIQTATTSNPVSGTKHVKLYNSTSPSTSNIILVSPQVSNLSAGTHQLRFYAKNVGNATQDIEVGTVSSPTDGSTFTSLQSVDIDGTYTEYTVNFSSYSGADQYIAIRRLSTHNYSYVWLDDIVWEVIPSCPQPLTSSLNASNITTTSADLSWTAGGTETIWNIEYGVAGFTQGTGTSITGTTTSPYNLTGLTGTTSYDFYIQADCGGGDTSTWAGPFSFSTACATVTTFPFVEEFEGITSEQPNCWGVSGTTTNTNYHWFSYSTGNTGRGIRFNSFSNANGNTSELTTPLIDLSSLSTAQLSFYFKNPTGGNFEVLISIDGGTTYTSLDNNLTGQTTWLAKTYDITSYIGSNVKIQFKGTSNYANGDAYIYLDSVEVNTLLSTNNIKNSSGNINSYPNPVSNILNLEYTSEITNIRVINLLGQEVINQKNTTTNAQVDMSKLSNGTYIVNLTINNTVKTIKVIKK